MAKKTKVRKTKIRKDTTIAEAGARRAIEQCAQQLDAYSDDDPQVEALCRKLRASVDGKPHPDPGAPENWGLTKVERSLGEMTELRKRDDLDPETAERLREANRALQTEYLHQVAPRSSQIADERRAYDRARRAA